MSIKSADNKPTVEVTESIVSEEIPLTLTTNESRGNVSDDDEDDDLDIPPDFSSVKDDETDENEPQKSEDTEDVNAVLEVKKVECLQCGCLVTLIPAPKKLPSCHFSRADNDDCPAKSVKIVKYVPVKKIVDAFLRAERTGNNERLGELYQTLAKKSEWEQQRITEALREARKM